MNYEPKNVYEVISKSLDILFDGRSRESLEQSDFVVDLNVPEAKVFSTKKVDYCYDIGYVTTISKIKAIKTILE